MKKLLLIAMIMICFVMIILEFCPEILHADIERPSYSILSFTSTALDFLRSFEIADSEYFIILSLNIKTRLYLSNMRNTENLEQIHHIFEKNYSMKDLELFMEKFSKITPDNIDVMEYYLYACEGTENLDCQRKVYKIIDSIDSDYLFNSGNIVPMVSTELKTQNFGNAIKLVEESIDEYLVKMGLSYNIDRLTTDTIDQLDIDENDKYTLKRLLFYYGMAKEKKIINIIPPKEINKNRFKHFEKLLVFNKEARGIGVRP